MKSKGRIYISGPVSNRTIAEAVKHFSAAEQKLKSHGFHTVNPLNMRLCTWLASHGHYRLCLLIELVWLAYTCKSIYMLDDWQLSGGARTEKSLAVAIGKRVLYENYKPRNARKSVPRVK